MRGDLADLVFEHCHPRLDTALRGVVTEVGHAGGNEQVVELGVAELLQSVQQKLAARLGDDRVFDATTAADRGRQHAAARSTGFAISGRVEHRLLRPVGEAHLRARSGEGASASKGCAQVVDQREGRLAHILRAVGFFIGIGVLRKAHPAGSRGGAGLPGNRATGHADQALLFRLAVAVLHEDLKELESLRLFTDRGRPARKCGPSERSRRSMHTAGVLVQL